MRRFANIGFVGYARNRLVWAETNPLWEAAQDRPGIGIASSARCWLAASLTARVSLFMRGAALARGPVLLVLATARGNGSILVVTVKPASRHTFGSGVLEPRRCCSARCDR